MITAHRISRRYGDSLAVRELSFSIGQGEIVGLLGHNGAGKTTIMKMLTGYLEPTSGSIQFDGLDLVKHRRTCQRKIGFLPENCPLYTDMRVIDFLAYQAELHGVASEQMEPALRRALQRTELTHKAEQPIATLSRGYRQRVGVAQALLHDPQVLVLDEPTNGLDPVQIQHMRALVRDLARQATVILSTHILQEVQAVCDRVLIIRKGELALDSRLSDLQTSHRLIAELSVPPEISLDTLGRIAGVTKVSHLSSRDERHLFALDTQPALGDPTNLAPEVARAVIAQGWALYGLRAEIRDLETIVGEINAVVPQKESSHG